MVLGGRLGVDSITSPANLNTAAAAITAYDLLLLICLEICHRSTIFQPNAAGTPAAGSVRSASYASNEYEGYLQDKLEK